MTKLQNYPELNLFTGIENEPTTTGTGNSRVAFVESGPVAVQETAPLFSLYDPPITNTRPCKNISLEQSYFFVKHGELKAKTEKIRAETEEDVQQKIKKDTLPYVTFSGTFTSRANDNLINNSGFFCVDLDHTDIMLKDTLSGDTVINPVLIFVSPRGKGLKLVIYIHGAKAENHTTYFQAIEKYFQDTYQMAIDEACKDVSRACFLCHDPEVYYNPEGFIESDVLLSYLPTNPPFNQQTN